jgi:hypothetical protein
MTPPIPNTYAERKYFGEIECEFDRHAHLFPCELEREEAIDLILFYAGQGRVKAAWSDVRREIQKHFENRPDDGSWMDRTTPESWTDKQLELRRAAHAEWLKGLQALLALRRNIPKIAAASVRRLPSYEREAGAVFNRFIGEAA